MALTQSDLDALDRAIASSELEVEMDGKRVRFASFADLVARRNFVAGVLNQGSAGSTPTRPTGTFRFTFTTGRE